MCWISHGYRKLSAMHLIPSTPRQNRCGSRPGCSFLQPFPVFWRVFWHANMDTSDEGGLTSIKITKWVSLRVEENPLEYRQLVAENSHLSWAALCNQAQGSKPINSGLWGYGSLWNQNCTFDWAPPAEKGFVLKAGPSPLSLSDPGVWYPLDSTMRVLYHVQLSLTLIPANIT